MTDHLGSTNGLADSSGNLTASTNYDAFGNASNVNFPTRYQFTGREIDNFTGLHYYRARFYDANLGRFISEDPIGFAGGDVNLYGYVQNNPAMMRDPSGKIPILIPIVIGAGALILSSPSYVNAPGPGDPVYDSRSDVVANAVMGAAGGYVLRIVGGALFGAIASKFCGAGDDIIELGISGGPTKLPTSNNSVPLRGYHNETFAPTPVRPQNAVDEWENFLGKEPYSNKHPRTGQPDPDRIVSADGTRSIRYGNHEMGSKPTKHHYHEEIWTHDKIRNVMNVDSYVIRVPLPKK